jgi:hypothetical protein
MGIKELWADPLLRYSNVLDGLFHNKVVICESDSDCRFYGAIYDVLSDRESATPKKDIMFTHCGGKARLPTVVRALRNLRVPVCVVADFDILNDKTPLDKVYQELGGEWSEIADLWRQVKSAIDSKKPELSSDEVKKEISEVLAGIAEPIFPDRAKEDIRKILRRSTPWATAKSVGSPYIPSGDAHQAYDALAKKCSGKGLYVVDVGELEGFVRSVGSHGPAWVNSVLSRKNLTRDGELETARRFVAQLTS